MIWTIFMVLLIMWALGLVSGYTMVGGLHIFLFVAIVTAFFQLFQAHKRV